jgi:hypothetical protein
MIEAVERLQKHPLPAVCEGNPGLYILCKKDENSMTVGLWNLLADEVISPTITLDRDYTSIDCYRCDGRLEGNQVLMQDDLPPFGFALFTVSF